MTLLGRAILILLSLPIAIARADNQVSVLRVPDGGMQPQAMVDSRGRIHLIYCKGDPAHGDAFYVLSEDAGKSFSAPVRVNSQPGSVVAIGTVRGPHLALGRDDRVHVAWMGSGLAEPKLAKNQAPMLYSRLSDKADVFEPQRNVIHDHPGLDGGGSIAADRNGNVYVAWHAPETLGAGETNRHVWLARSKDDGQTFESETDFTPGDRGACGCCGMKILADDSGGVYALFRSAFQSIHRDIYLVTSEDFGRTSKAVDIAPWELGACVMSTSSIARDRNGRIAIAWEQPGNIGFGTLRPGADVKLALHQIDGIGHNPKHPAIAVNRNGSTLLAWTEGTAWARGGRLAWQLFDSAGQSIGKGGADGLPAWDMPTVVSTNDGNLLLLY